VPIIDGSRLILFGKKEKSKGSVMNYFSELDRELDLSHDEGKKH